jgi:hypothetical protein
MEKYTKKELENIYKKLDVVKFFEHYHVRQMQQYGDELRMCCVLPDHNDMSPSASFNTEQGIYNCYVCGGRNIFSLVKDLENLPSFVDAVEFIKNKVGYNSEDYDKINELLEQFNELQVDNYDDDEKPELVKIDLSVYPEFEDAFDHFLKVKSRVSRKMIKKWDIKYATSGYYKDRLVIPIKYESSTYSFAARDMSGQSEKWLKLLKKAKKDKLTVIELAELRSKYECKKIIYPPLKNEEIYGQMNIIYGTSIKYLLFNLDNAIKRTTDYVILVEGVFDAMRLFTLGYNAIAILGTKLSKYNKAILLSKFDKIYVALDNDVSTNKKNAGQLAAQKIIESLISHIDCFNIVLPPNKDPDECSEEEFKQCFDDAAKIEF